jgi:hypothetical protein
MGSPDLTARPLGLAEVIDRSIALARRHFRALFLTMLVFQVPTPLLARQLASVPLPVPGEATFEPELLWRAGFAFLALLALQLLPAAAAAGIVAPSLDPRRDAGRPRWPRALLAVGATTALQLAVLGLAPVVGALPGLGLAFRSDAVAVRVAGLVGAAFGGLGLLLVAFLRFLLAPTVAALEGRAGGAALVRSARLMSPRPGTALLERPGVRASLILLAVFVLSTAVNSLAGLPRLVALRAHGLVFLGTQLPLAVEIPIAVFEAVANSVLQPFSVVALVVFYFDRRARSEGLDVELWAERLEQRA